MYYKMIFITLFNYYLFLLKIMCVFSKVILLHYGYKKTCFLKTLIEIQNLSISFTLKKINPLTGEADEKTKRKGSYSCPWKPKSSLIYCIFLMWCV